MKIDAQNGLSPFQHLSDVVFRHDDFTDEAIEKYQLGFVFTDDHNGNSSAINKFSLKGLAELNDISKRLNESLDLLEMSTKVHRPNVIARFFGFFKEDENRYQAKMSAIKERRAAIAKESPKCNLC